MTTSPRLKYPFVAGMGISVYRVTTKAKAAKIAAAARSRGFTPTTSQGDGRTALQYIPGARCPSKRQAPGAVPAPIGEEITAGQRNKQNSNSRRAEDVISLISRRGSYAQICGVVRGYPGGRGARRRG